MKLKSSLAILALAILSACQKSTTEPNTLSPYANYSFQNKTGSAVIVRVEDIATGEKFYMNLAANVATPMPLGWLADGKRVRHLSYYWATTDFEMSSWYTGGTKWLHDSADVSYRDSRYIYNVPIQPVYKSKRMKYFLNGIEGPTTWVAVDAYNDFGKSVWDTLNNIAKSHKIILDYKKTGTHEHASRTGAGIKDYFYYDFLYQVPTEESDIYLLSNGYSSADTSIPTNYSITMRNIVYGTASLHTSSTDTLFLIINQRPPYYKMAKLPGS